MYAYRTCLLGAGTSRRQDSNKGYYQHGHVPNTIFLVTVRNFQRMKHNNISRLITSHTNILQRLPTIFQLISSKQVHRSFHKTITTVQRFRAVNAGTTSHQHEPTIFQFISSKQVHRFFHKTISTVQRFRKLNSGTSHQHENEFQRAFHKTFLYGTLDRVVYCQVAINIHEIYLNHSDGM